MPLYLVEDKKDEPGAPSAEQAPEHRTHPIAKALALTAGAFALLAGGFALGTACGQDVLRAWMPSIAATEPAPVVRQAELEDGYDGALARRVAEASSQLASSGVDEPSLDVASDGAIDGLLSVSGDGSASYLSPEEYERFVAAPAPGASAASSRADSSRESSRSRAADAAVASEDTLPEGSATGVVRGVGVIRVALLCDGTLAQGASEAISKAVGSLSSAGATSFVLDLRGVFGSDMAEAVRVASLFLDGGTVARTHGASGDDVLEVQSGACVTSAPLTVLVDDTTYGTPEVVAGALQDHQRALVAGRVSAGGAAMQEVRELSSGGALVMASAQVATPDDRAINGRGIAPDLVCAADARVSGAGTLAQRDVQLAAAVACSELWQRGGVMAVAGLTNAPGPQDAAFDDEPSDVTGMLVEAGLATSAAASSVADASSSSSSADADGAAGEQSADQPAEEPAEGEQTAADAEAPAAEGEQATEADAAPEPAETEAA